MPEFIGSFLTLSFLFKALSTMKRFRWKPSHSWKLLVLYLTQYYSVKTISLVSLRKLHFGIMWFLSSLYYRIEGFLGNSWIVWILSFSFLVRTFKLYRLRQNARCYVTESNTDGAKVSLNFLPLLQSCWSLSQVLCFYSQKGTNWFTILPALHSSLVCSS